MPLSVFRGPNQGIQPKSNRNQTEIKPFLENMFYRFMNPPIRVGPCLSVVQSLQPATFNLQPATCIRGSKSATILDLPLDVCGLWEAPFNPI